MVCRVLFLFVTHFVIHFIFYTKTPPTIRKSWTVGGIAISLILALFHHFGGHLQAIYQHGRDIVAHLHKILADGSSLVDKQAGQREPPQQCQEGQIQAQQVSAQMGEGRGNQKCHRDDGPVPGLLYNADQAGCTALFVQLAAFGPAGQPIEDIQQQISREQIPVCAEHGGEQGDSSTIYTFSDKKDPDNGWSFSGLEIRDIEAELETGADVCVLFSGDICFFNSRGDNYFQQIVGVTGKYYLEKALRMAAGNKSKAARLLGLASYQRFDFLWKK